MREILFRGKRIDNGEWVYGYFVKVEKLNVKEEYEYFIIEIDKNGHPYEVDPESVGQYTGLKDKNGIKIFEGDILYCYDWRHKRWLVEYKELYACFVCWNAEDKHWHYLTDIWEDSEIIGNIYDNPELFEKGE